MSCVPDLRDRDDLIVPGDLDRGRDAFAGKQFDDIGREPGAAFRGDGGHHRHEPILNLDKIDIVTGGKIASRRVRRAIGLDDSPCWIIVSEHNIDEWPNAGLAQLPGQPGVFSYGLPGTGESVCK